MFAIPKKYQTKIPPVTTDHPLWVLSLGYMTRHYSKYWNPNYVGDPEHKEIDHAVQALERDFDFKDKVVCVLGSGNGFFGHIAEMYGARKIIGIEKEFWPVVYTRGLYPNWDIEWGDYSERMETLPEASIYLYPDMVEGKRFIPSFHEKHERAFKEMERLRNG